MSTYLLCISHSIEAIIPRFYRAHIARKNKPQRFQRVSKVSSEVETANFGVSQNGKRTISTSGPEFVGLDVDKSTTTL